MIEICQIKQVLAPVQWYCRHILDQGPGLNKMLPNWSLYSTIAQNCDLVDIITPWTIDNGPCNIMAIDYGAMDGSIVVGKGYRLAHLSIYCRR